MPSHRFEPSGSPPMHPHPPHGPAAANESRVPDAGSASPGHKITYLRAAQRLLPCGQSHAPPPCPSVICCSSCLCCRRRRLGMSPPTCTCTLFMLFKLSAPKSLSPQCPNHPVHQPQARSIRFSLPAPDSFCSTSDLVSVWLGEMRRSPAGPLSFGCQALSDTEWSHTPAPRVTRRPYGQAPRKST